MRAAWYERQGPAEDVLHVGDHPDPAPGPGEVRVRVRASGVSTTDVAKRGGWFGHVMAHPLVIPHSDGAGEVDAVGPEVDPARVGERVWCYGAQAGRPFGTAAELVVLPERQAVRLPDGVSLGEGACLGIAGLTAHRALLADGPIEGKTVLVAGAAGAVGSLAAQLAACMGATVLATVRTPEDVSRARRTGAEHVFVLGEPGIASAILEAAPRGVDRIVEVALSANADLDAKVLARHGVIAAYSSSDVEPRLPFWALAQANATVRLLWSDGFPEDAADAAAAELVECLEQGRMGVEVGAWFPLEQIAAAHDAVERPSGPGRIVVLLD